MVIEHHQSGSATTTSLSRPRSVDFLTYLLGFSLGEISHRTFDVLVTKKFLHCFQIHAILQEPGGECGTEFVWVGILHFGCIGNLNAIIPTMRVLVAIAVGEHQLATPWKFLEYLQQFIRHLNITSFPRLRLPVLLRRDANNTSREI